RGVPRAPFVDLPPEPNITSGSGRRGLFTGARARLNLLDQVGAVFGRHADERIVAHERQKMAATRRAQAASVRRFVHGPDDRLSLNRHHPSRPAPVVWNRALDRTGDRCNPIEAGWSIGIVDDDVSHPKVFAGVAWQRPPTQVEEIVVVD